MAANDNPYDNSYGGGYDTGTQPDKQQQPNAWEAPTTPPPYLTIQSGQGGPQSPFSSSSSYSDLVAQLNSRGAAPGTDAFNELTRQYTDAHGLTGQDVGNGFQYGQLDPGRNKIYVPGGYDLKYENGQWVPHQEGPGGGAGGYTPGAADPRAAALYDQLLKRSQQTLAVNANDPTIQAQVNPYAATQTRAMRQNLAKVAEANGPNANIGAETRHAGELAGQNTANFQAQIIGREIDARRQEIAQALSGMFGVLSLDQQRALQEEDNALKSRGLDLQGQGLDNAAAQQAWENQYRTIFG